MDQVDDEKNKESALASLRRSGDAEPVAEGPIDGGLLLAVGGTQVLWFVVPRAAAQHPAKLGITLDERL